MPIKSDREYRSMIPLAIGKKEKRIDSDYYVEGYATTFDKPYLMYEFDGIKYYEVIDRNALSEADLSDVIFQYNHQGKVLARNSNKTLGIEPNENGLFIFPIYPSQQQRKRCMRKLIMNLLLKCHGHLL
jgi:phage head maturation protease